MLFGICLAYFIWLLYAVGAQTSVSETNNQEVSCDDLGSYLYHCRDGSCINRTAFCDGTTGCRDGSDEATNTSLFDGIMCQYRSANPIPKRCVLPNEFLCDHEIDCVGGRDECDCEHSFQCDNGDCVLKVSFCDNLEPNWGCLDGSDEIEYNRSAPNGFQCPVTRTFMTKACVLPDRYICDGDSDCDFGIDECFCNFTDGKKKGHPLNHAFSNENCFRCLDRSLVIPNIHVCDGIIHCDDLSDECACPEKKGYQKPEICKWVCQGSDCDCPGQMQCTPRETNISTEISVHNETEPICIDKTSICDRITDCTNKLDEAFCPEDENTFECYDGSRIIGRHQLCNGPIDCPDDSDEMNCHDIHDFFCNEYRIYFPHIQDWSNGNETSAGVAIPNGVEIRFDRPFFTKKCDGVALCSRMEDECSSDCPEVPEFCEHSIRGFRCPNSGSNLIGIEVCDGKPTCNDTHPEESMDEMGCPGRFYCKNKGSTRLPIHIPIQGKCNGKQECDDLSDELNCSEKTHFYCNDGGSTLFVLVNQVCDGTSDCKEGGDECQNCNPSPFSSDERLINSRVLIWFLWIIGLFSVLGNTANITLTVIGLIRPSGTVSVISVSNKILVLNLSMADLLVGFYLMGLGIKDVTVSSYCVTDQEWRSSSTCSGLGVMALIGTETSVFILTIMTAYRLHLVMRPFKQQKSQVIIFAVLMSWLASSILAFAPLAKSAQDYFVSCVWFRTHQFIGKICRNDLQSFVRNLELFDTDHKLFGYNKKGDYSWDNMISAMKQLNSTYEPGRYFGYYSAHSVCLPRLFPDPEKDEAWGYSLFIILINFSAFVFVLLSYILIYRITTRQNIKRSNERTSLMQRKISRIVLSDFCCWMPICMMSFLRVGGVVIPDLAYAFTAIILLPINSAMNPLLYSDVLDILWEKFRPADSIMKGVERRLDMMKDRKISKSIAAKVISNPATDETSGSTARISVSSPPGTRTSSTSNDLSSSQTPSAQIPPNTIAVSTH